jgi:4'-phosphopantetheinyl transferase
VIALDPRDVDVWTAEFGGDDVPIDPLFEMLSPFERERANRFRFPEHRSRYVFAHALLRKTLARYMATEPASIEFRHNHFGKPFLVQRNGVRPPFFNLSHSGPLVAIAISADRPVGADVERLAIMRDMDAIAERWFAPCEREAVHAAPASDKARTFYTFWVRKEAYVKGRGQGLSIPLQSFDTSIVRGSVRPARESAGQSRIDAWRICDLPMPDGCVGALAVEGAVRRCLVLPASVDAQSTA